MSESWEMVKLLQCLSFRHLCSFARQVILTAESTLLLSLVLCGCGILHHDGVSGSPKNTQKPISNTYAIAAGVLESWDTNSYYGVARVRIEETLRGKIATNSIQVLYYPDTIPQAGLPSRPILILEHDEGYPVDTHFAIGGDAYRGFLPDSEALRLEVATESYTNFFQSHPEDRISRDKAMETAVNEVSRRGDGKDLNLVVSGTTRYNFGWTVFVQFVDDNGIQIIGISVVMEVGDDNRIKMYSRGL
jgi:hypothetical protein